MWWTTAEQTLGAQRWSSWSLICTNLNFPAKHGGFPIIYVAYLLWGVGVMVAIQFDLVDVHPKKKLKGIVLWYIQILVAKVTAIKILRD